MTIKPDMFRFRHLADIKLRIYIQRLAIPFSMTSLQWMV